MTNELDLHAYLTSKGVQVWKGGGNELTANCWWCDETHKKGKLYLNRDSWLHECKVCLARGNRKTLLEHFGDEDEVQHPQASDPMLRRRILTEVSELAHEMLLANDTMLDYLLRRGISAELIIAKQLGYVPKNFGVTDSIPSRKDIKGYLPLLATGLITEGGRDIFSDTITIPFFSHGSVVSVRGRMMSSDVKYLTAGGDNARLYNADALNGADRVLVVEGEFDGLAVLTQIDASGDRFFEGLAVVALSGAGSWPDGFVAMLSTCSKVFIGLDPDETGDKAARKLKDEVGSKARLVELPRDLDWTDYFKAGHDYRDLRNLLIEADLAGKQMFSIGDIATKWSRRESEAPGLKLGWPSLDAVLRPGLKPGQVMIPLATTGTGKTVFLSNIAHNLHKKKVLFASLEMTGAEVYEHLRRIHRFWNPSADREELIEDYKYLRITERNRLAPGDLEHVIHEYQDEVGATPDVVIVDYLQYFARGFRGSSMYDRVSEAVMETKAVGKAESTAIIIPSQVNRGAERGKPLSLDDARDAGTIEETADFVVSLFRPDLVDIGGQDPDQKMLTGAFKTQFLKSRHGGVGRVCDLRHSMLSLAIVDAIFDAAAYSRVEAENRIYRSGTHYADYRQQLDDAIAQGVLA